MPTPEEIKKIAEEYARYTCSDISDAQERATDENIEYDFALPILEWLSERYCIVPKEVIKADYDFNKTTVEQFAKGNATRCVIVREWHQGKCDELISLFGKSLFNEEKE